MYRELKVYNQFEELSLHLRLSLQNGFNLHIIDGTPKMRAAIGKLRGVDFDRTVAKNNEMVRFVADWGSSEYLDMLSHYFVENFGWRTQIVETQPELAVLAVGLPSTVVHYVPSGFAFPADNATLVARVTENRPDRILEPRFAYV